MDEFGYVILDNAMSPAQAEAMRGELEPYFDARANCHAHFYGFNTKRIEALFAKSEMTRRMAVNPVVLAVTQHLLGANCDSFQVNLTQGIRINPGEKAQIIHPDSALFPMSNKPFEFQVNTIWPSSPFRRENGATQLVPGSHRWPEGRSPQPHEITCAEMDPGSVLVYAASLLHGGGANTTREARTGIVISYCLGWLRQAENQYLSYPPEVARTFDEQLQRLIGYNVHKPNLGWVHGHDPIDLLTMKEHGNAGAAEFLTDAQIKLLEDYHDSSPVALTSHNLQSA
ncbi:phytanoyl-CoA dioxygenase family protein [Tautonia sp. JC769]|uniref:phytanoyl-CoA dioxygenase family protein n=1 Tax=Tautonia sp. JC769 TaxID=3232135 RepID=UPI00345947D3